MEKKEEITSVRQELIKMLTAKSRYDLTGVIDIIKELPEDEHITINDYMGDMMTLRITKVRKGPELYLNKEELELDRKEGIHIFCDPYTVKSNRVENLIITLYDDGSGNGELNGSNILEIDLYCCEDYSPQIKFIGDGWGWRSLGTRDIGEIMTIAEEHVIEHFDAKLLQPGAVVVDFRINELSIARTREINCDQLEDVLNKIRDGETKYFNENKAKPLVEIMAEAFEKTSVQKEDSLNKMNVKLYGKCKEGRFWWSLDDRCGDGVDLIDEQVFMIPDGFSVADDRSGELSFFKGDEYAVLNTNKKGRPYLSSLIDLVKPVYLVKEEKSQTGRKDKSKEAPYLM